MRSILIVLLLSIVGLCCVGGQSDAIVYPPHTDGMNSMYIYPYYIIAGDIGVGKRASSSEKIYLSDDFSVYELCGDSAILIGAWRISRDTLYIYQDWIETFAGDFVGNAEYDFRLLLTGLHRRKSVDSQFPCNVSVFKVINKGDSLVSIADEMGNIGIPISKDVFETFHGVIGPCIDFKDSLGAFKNTNIIIRPNLEETFIWQAKSVFGSNTYSIANVNRIDGAVISLLVDNRGLHYRILNPKMYPQLEAQLLAESAEYSTWMDSVRPGDSIALELFRPAYDAEVFERSPYLSASPDTVYVLDGDVYGYWFARPLSTSK